MAAGRLRLVRYDRDLPADSAFTSVDLPTFGRPTTATIPQRNALGFGSVTASAGTRRGAARRARPSRALPPLDVPVASEHVETGERVLWTLGELLPAAFRIVLHERVPLGHRGGRRTTERRQVHARERARRPEDRDRLGQAPDDPASRPSDPQHRRGRRSCSPIAPGFHKPSTLLWHAAQQPGA